MSHHAKDCNIIENNLLGKLITAPSSVLQSRPEIKTPRNLQSPKPSTWLRHTQTSGAGHARRARREEIGHGDEPVTHLKRL
jgi:hypothetical protein